MIEKAVIDRYEEDKAVLLVGELQWQIIVPRESLPQKAKEGSWLKITLNNKTVESISLDEKETNKVRQRIADKLASLRRGGHL